MIKKLEGSKVGWNVLQKQDWETDSNIAKTVNVPHMQGQKDSIRYIHADHGKIACHALMADPRPRADSCLPVA